jgi:hypothetical protein
MRKLLAALVLTCTPVAFAAPASAAPLCEGKKMGFAGMMAKCNRETLPPLTLASGQPLSEGPLKLQSGAYYKLDIVADGSAELAISGADFFRAVWVNEIVINSIEIRPLGVDSIEFDKAGTVEMSFIALKPGRYELKIPGTKGETQRVQVSIQ